MTQKNADMVCDCGKPARVKGLCRNCYQRAYRRTHESINHRLIREARARRGDACENCDEALRFFMRGKRHVSNLDWHHRDPAAKEFDVTSVLNSGNPARFEAELAKCTLLCRPCHRRVHQANTPKNASSLMIELRLERITSELNDLNEVRLALELAA